MSGENVLGFLDFPFRFVIFPLFSYVVLYLSGIGEVLGKCLEGFFLCQVFGRFLKGYF